MNIKTAHGYISFQPDGRLEYRQFAGSWETFTIEGVPTPPPPSVGPLPPIDDDRLLGCGLDLYGIELVSCLCEKIHPAGNLALAFEVTKRVAWGMRNTGAGLLLKRGGENIVSWRGESFSASRICYPSGQLYKILSDVPTTNDPSWQDNGFVNADLYCPAIDPSLQ